MKTYYFITTIFALTFIGCAYGTKLASGHFFGHKSQKVAKKYLGEYANIFGSTNGILGLKYSSHGGPYKGGSSLIDNSLSGEDSEGEIFINEELFTRARVGIYPNGNPYQFCYEECQFYNGACFCEEDRTKHFYGDSVSLKYYYNGEIKLEKSLYVPPLINVSFPTSSFKDHIIVDRSEFAVSWNKDDKNDYGVLIAIFSLGHHPETVMNSKVKAKMTQTSFKVPDTGYYEFDPVVFEGLRSGSIVTLLVMRGRMPVETDHSGNPYTLRFMSEYYASVKVL